MLLVKITIMDIQYKAALLQLTKITFEESENDDLNLIIHSSNDDSSSNDDEDEEEIVRNIKKIIKLIL